MTAHKTITLDTSQLRTGMIVWTHGLRCEIDREISWKNYPAAKRDPQLPAGTVYWTNALVTNRDDVPSDSVPCGWTTTEHYPSRGLAAEPEGTHRWTIQGNHLARWTVELPDDIAAFPFEEGESILWFTPHADGGHAIRVRTASGFEGMHDTYPPRNPDAPERKPGDGYTSCLCEGPHRGFGCEADR